jgi:putative DNA primase/helicase
LSREWDARVRAAEELLRADQPSSAYALTEKGKIKITVANAIIMLRHLPLAYNSFSCRIVITGKMPWPSKGEWTDVDDVKAAEWCQHQRLNINQHVAFAAIEAVAREHTVHPVVDYLESLTWDGVPRLDRWLYKYLGCPDNPYVRSVAVKWMIAAVGRVMRPGCQADYTLVLEGKQGKRKSTALRVLGDAWFSDDLTDIGHKDSAMQLQAKWIVEVSELDAFRKVLMTTIKAWLVRRIDNFRPPYGKRTMEYPRQNVFAASTNKDAWGHDDTGLRRFWPVKVGNINIEALTADRDQLWAEAVHRYRAGETSWMSDGNQEAAAAIEQRERQEEDPWTREVLAWAQDPMPRPGGPPMLSSTGVIYATDALWHGVGVPEKDWNKLLTDRVTGILRLAGFSSKRAPRPGRREFWTPCESAAR